MSKAAQSPTSHRKRVYLIADHVVDQMRKRYTREGIGYRDESDLKNLVDSAVVEAIRNQHSRNILDDGKPATIVWLQRSLGDNLWALMRKNTDSNHPSFELAVITLLKNEQVERSMTSGKFKANDGSGFSITEENKERLRSISPVTPSKATAMEHNQVEPHLEAWFVHYSTKSGGPQVPEEYDDSEVALKRMDELSNQQKVVPGTVRLSKAVNTQRRFTLQEN